MKKLLFTLLGLFLTVIRVSALEFTVGDFSYSTLEDNKVALTDILLPYNSDVVIPSTIIYDEIEYTVTELKPHNVINDFKSLYIPETIETIDDYFFYYYDIMNEIIIHPDNQFFKVVDGILYSKDGTKIITCIKYITEITLSEGLEEIGNFAFRLCRLITTVNLPKSLKKISQSAFISCHKLKNVYINENLEKMDDNVFHYSPIEYFEISPDNQFFSEFDGCIYSKDYSKLIICPNNKKTISFHPNISSLRSEVFIGCNQIEEITIPKTIKSIPYSAFAYCGNLKKIIIPESVESINAPFYGCPNLEYLIIPKSVQSLSGFDISPIKGPYILLNPDTQLSGTNTSEDLTIYAKGNTFSSLREHFPNFTVLPLPEKIFGEPSPFLMSSASSNVIPSSLNIQPACGFQVDMTFPEGLSLTDVKLMGSFSADSVKYSFSQLENGDYRVIGYSVDGSIMPVARAYFYVSPDENFKRGKIICHDAVLSLYDNEYQCEDQEWKMLGYNIDLQLPGTIVEGETFTIPNPIEGAPEDVTYSFVSGNTNIVTVDGNTLTAQAPGTVEITVNVDDEGMKMKASKTIEVLAALWGDADGSEAIDVADIVAMVNHILGRSSENFNSRLADIDRNGRINIADLTALIRIILTQPQAESVAVNSRAMADNVNREVSFGEAEDLGGDYLRVPVELDVTADYSAMQGEIVIPEGMSLEKMQLAGELGKHTLDYAMVGDNRARFVIYSISLASLPADRKSAVASVTLHGRTTSDDVLCLNDAIVCDNDCVTYSLGSATMTFEGMSGLDALRASGFGVRAVRSGIELTAPAETSARITDLSGRTVADVTAPTSVTLPAGLYIVSFADGPVMKVVVK